jgi:hypothetical protein
MHDGLTLQAGLFSAILSAFLIEIRKGLQEDLQSITNNLLTILIENQGTVAGRQTPSSSRFVPSSASRWVNGLWFSSLIFSLMSALGASLAKGWITQFSSTVSGSGWGDALLHCRRLQGLRRWHLKLIIQCLPILIHIALFLFAVGLVILLFQDDVAIGVLICVLTLLIFFLYIGSSLHPTFYADSPFRTPLSGMIERGLAGSLQQEEFAPFPSRKDAQKARALTWLLTGSPNVDTVNAVIRAIAGLPANPGVQDELFRGPSVALVLRILSTELASLTDENATLQSCLYALFHFVQAAPVRPEDATSLVSLRKLVDPGGAHSDIDLMPVAMREIALCVKGRIILLLCDDIRDTTLFNTDIPVFARSCTDAHLRRLLIELCLLASRPSRVNKLPICDFLAVLKDPTAARRDEVHTQLVQHALSRLSHRSLLERG